MTGGDPPLLNIRLFGPFEARVNGEALPRLRTRKGEGLLARLTLRVGRAVERDWLAGVLWPESAERAGAGERPAAPARPKCAQAGGYVEEPHG